MGIKVYINSITGQSPFYLFICDNLGNNCVYVDKTDTIPFEFQIPEPYDTQTEYKLKIIDGNGVTITGNSIVQG